MSKKAKITLTIFVIVVILIVVYFNRPMFSFNYEDDLNCSNTASGPPHYTHCSIYNLRFFINDNGIHFLSKSQFKKVKEAMNEIKSKNYETVNRNDYVCIFGGQNYAFYKLNGKTYRWPAVLFTGEDNGFDMLYELCTERGSIYYEK